MEGAVSGVVIVKGTGYVAKKILDQRQDLAASRAAFNLIASLLALPCKTRKGRERVDGGGL
jgi:hypothetical protein